MTGRDSEQLWRSASAVALGVGLATTATPAAFARLLGFPTGELTYTALFALRLFGVRTAVIGGAALAGNGWARAAIAPLQLLDQLVFVHAIYGRGVPRQPVFIAMAISSGLLGASLAATRRAGQPSTTATPSADRRPIAEVAPSAHFLFSLA